MPTENTYCVYCAVGKDSRVVTSLEQLGYTSLSFQQMKRYFSQGKQRVRRVAMLPRYIFFDAGEEPDWYRIRAIPHVQKILEYSDGRRAFREDDLDFVRWMKSLNGMMYFSQVMQVGSKIRVVGGPLIHYEGQIVEVKKHRNMVAIRIGEEAHFSKIWCPVEYIERA